MENSLPNLSHKLIMVDLYSLLGYEKGTPKYKTLAGDISTHYCDYVSRHGEMSQSYADLSQARDCASEFLAYQGRPHELFPPNLGQSLSWPQDNETITTVLAYLFRRLAVSSNTRSIQKRNRIYSSKAKNDLNASGNRSIPKKRKGVVFEEFDRENIELERKNNESKINALDPHFSLGPWMEPAKRPSRDSFVQYVMSLNPKINPDQSAGLTKAWLATPSAEWPGIADLRLQFFMHEAKCYLAFDTGSELLPFNFLGTLRQGTDIEDISGSQISTFAFRVRARIVFLTHKMAHEYLILEFQRDGTPIQTERFKQLWQSKARIFRDDQYTPRPRKRQRSSQKTQRSSSKVSQAPSRATLRSDSELVSIAGSALQDVELEDSEGRERSIPVRSPTQPMLETPSSSYHPSPTPDTSHGDSIDVDMPFLSREEDLSGYFSDNLEHCHSVNEQPAPADPKSQPLQDLRLLDGQPETEAEAEMETDSFRDDPTAAIPTKEPARCDPAPEGISLDVQNATAKEVRARRTSKQPTCEDEPEPAEPAKSYDSRAFPLPHDHHFMPASHAQQRATSPVTATMTSNSSTSHHTEIPLPLMCENRRPDPNFNPGSEGYQQRRQVLNKSQSDNIDPVPNFSWRAFEELSQHEEQGQFGHNSNFQQQSGSISQEDIRSQVPMQKPPPTVIAPNNHTAFNSPWNTVSSRLGDTLNAPPGVEADKVYKTCNAPQGPHQPLPTLNATIGVFNNQPSSSIPPDAPTPSQSSYQPPAELQQKNPTSVPFNPQDGFPTYYHPSQKTPVTQSTSIPLKRPVRYTPPTPPNRRCMEIPLNYMSVFNSNTNDPHSGSTGINQHSTNHPPSLNQAATNYHYHSTPTSAYLQRLEADRFSRAINHQNGNPQANNTGQSNNEALLKGSEVASGPPRPNCDPQTPNPEIRYQQRESRASIPLISPRDETRAEIRSAIDIRRASTAPTCPGPSTVDTPQTLIDRPQLSKETEKVVSSTVISSTPVQTLQSSVTMLSPTEQKPILDENGSIFTNDSSATQLPTPEASTKENTCDDIPESLRNDDTLSNFLEPPNKKDSASDISHVELDESASRPYALIPDPRPFSTQRSEEDEPIQELSQALKLSSDRSIVLSSSPPVSQELYFAIVRKGGTPDGTGLEPYERNKKRSVVEFFRFVSTKLGISSSTLQTLTIMMSFRDRLVFTLEIWDTEAKWHDFLDRVESAFEIEKLKLPKKEKFEVWVIP